MSQRSLEEMLAAVRRQEALIRQRKVTLQARLTAQQKERQVRQRLLLGGWLEQMLTTDGGLREKVRAELLPGLSERDRELLVPLLEGVVSPPAEGQPAAVDGVSVEPRAASAAGEGSLL